MKYLPIIAIVLSLFSIGYTYQSQERVLGVATITSTASSDTLETFRTNVNSSLTNLRADAVATSTAYSWASLQQFANASSSIFSSYTSYFGGSATTTITSAGKVGIASSTPTSQLSVGTANATSTVSGGFFCGYFQDEAGRGMYIKLATSGSAVFATSTSSCN